MREEKKKKRGRVPFFSSIQMKYAMSYLAIVSVVLILLNTYPVLASQDLLFGSKRDSLKSQAAVMASALMELELLTSDQVERVMTMLDSSGLTRVVVTDPAGLILYDSTQPREKRGETAETAPVQEEPEEPQYRYALYQEVVLALGGNDVTCSEFSGQVFRSTAAVPIVYRNMTIGCVYPRTEEEIMEVKGRCLMTGLPRTFTLSSSEILEALEEVSSAIVEAIHSVLERTPPELTGDISSNGIVMTGGGSLIWGFDKLVASKTGIPTRVADEAVSCVAYGTGNCLENLASMQDGTINLSRKRQMR